MQQKDELRPLLEAIWSYCERENLPVFMSRPPEEEDVEEVDWDMENKDWHRFLMVAKSVGAKIIYLWVTKLDEFDLERASLPTLPQRATKEEKRLTDLHNQKVEQHRPIRNY